MARPILVTKYRGTNQAECEVFQNTNSNLTSLFTYGTAGLFTFSESKMQALAAHWRDSIYAICPGSGVFKNDPPSTSGVLVHAFDGVETGQGTYLMPWQTCWKDGKSQIFCMYRATTPSVGAVMVFIDEEENITTSPVIPTAFINNHNPMQRPLKFGNKFYDTYAATTSFGLHIVDPVAESWSRIGMSDGSSYAQWDLAIHNGKMYMYTQQAVVTPAGKGNALWEMDTAVPFKTLEWEGYQSSSNEFPGIEGQCLVFSDGTDLICMGYADGTVDNEIGMWQITLDGNGVPTGKVSIIDTVLGFDTLLDNEKTRYMVTRDLETGGGTIETHFYMTTGAVPLGSPYHMYKWNGVGAAATYLGLYGDAGNFDIPSSKIGGGRGSITDVDELNFTVTAIAKNGNNLDITYVLDGTAVASGVGMTVMYNNLKDSPITVATVTPVVNGVMNGSVMEQLSTGESGVFTWDLAADGISPGDIPNLSAFLTRTL